MTRLARTTQSGPFELRFPIDDVPLWSAQYAYASARVDPEAIGKSARKAGYLTHEQFLALGDWKTQRTRSRRAGNSASFVKEVTGTALNASEPRLKIEVLTLLDGVDYPTASAILHFCDRDRWPIIDFRAFWSLKQESPAGKYRFEIWDAYTKCTRDLADQANASMRVLDRALWAYSKKHQRT